MNFPDRLTELRRSKGWTQEDVAKMLGIARTTYAMYEQSRREPDIKTIGMLADLFEVSIDYLLGRSYDPTPPRRITADADVSQYGSNEGVNGSEEIDKDADVEVQRITEHMESEYGDYDPAMAKFLYKVIRDVLRDFDQFKRDQQNKRDKR